jgi:hypothetical protein
MMSVWYRCKQCGRFPLTDAFPAQEFVKPAPLSEQRESPNYLLKLDAAKILETAAQTPILPCPRCGKPSRRCC